MRVAFFLIVSFSSVLQKQGLLNPAFEGVTIEELREPETENQGEQNDCLQLILQLLASICDGQFTDLQVI